MTQQPKSLSSNSHTYNSGLVRKLGGHLTPCRLKQSGLLAIVGWHQPDSPVLPVSIVFGSIVLIATDIRPFLTYVSCKLVFAIDHDLDIELHSVNLYSDANTT